MTSRAFYEPDGVYGTRYEVFRGYGNSPFIGLREINGMGECCGPLVEATVNPERNDGKYFDGVLKALHRKAEALKTFGVVSVIDSKDTP